MGANTLIVKAQHDPWGRPSLLIDGYEPEILALLSVAHGCPQPFSVLTSLHQAPPERGCGGGGLVMEYLDD